MGDLLKNNSKLVKNISLTAILRGCSLIVSFFATPGYLRFFGDNDVLGVWFTLLSILNWVLNFDLGIGNGLRNKLALSIESNDKHKAKELVSSAYVSLCLLSFVVFTFCSICIWFINWNSVLNTTCLDNRNLSICIIIIFASVCAQLVLRLIVSIHYSNQNVVVGDVCTIVTNVIMIAFLYTFPSANPNEDLRSVSICYFVAVTLPLIFASFFSFIKPFSYCRPNIRFFDASVAKDIINLGGQFFAIQISLLILNSTNQWLISFLSTSKNVVEYQLYFKVFEIAVTVFSLLTQPVWSAITVKYSKNDVAWIKKVYLILLMVAVIGFVCTEFVAINLQTIFNIWLKEETIKSNFSIASIFAVFVFEQMLIYASTCVANGTSRLKCQVVWTIFAACIKIPLTFLTFNYFSDWYYVIIVHIVIMLPLLVFQIFDNIKLFRG